MTTTETDNSRRTGIPLLHVYRKEEDVLEQKVITSRQNYQDLKVWAEGKKKMMLVCGRSIRFLTGICDALEELKKSGVEIVRFSDFAPNPLYESVVKGVDVFRSEGCDSMLAVGGGSAMDVAKCIKLYSSMEGDGTGGSFLKQEIVPNDLPFLAIPTTAGTGSEATRYAVIYYEGKKQSVTDESSIPETVLLDPGVLKSLPLYQKKATMMDAFCHAIESFWSVNSTSRSREFSRDAIRAVMEHMDGYLANTEEGNAGMLMASNIAGKAINITQTTAGHAMCYKITGLFQVSHGHAAILCNRVLFPWMLGNIDKCIDPRGEEYLKKTLDEIGHAMGCEDAGSGAAKLQEIFDALELPVPTADSAQFEELRTSVNPDRLKNHPVALDPDAIDELYHLILN